jgi:glutathione S-transferase
MQLIGMLDSPYVRRVAISLLALGLPFKHRSISVFRGIDEFRRINPVVKAPTFVCDDGTVLMDSTLILEYVEALARPRSLLPSDPAALARSLRITGLALAACEKSAQLVYERALRPPEKRHGPWVQRVTGQLQAAYAELEALLAARPIDLAGRPPMQDGISAAVAWHFTQRVLAEHVPAAAHPALVALSHTAEALPLFRAAPHGEEAMDGGA